MFLVYAAIQTINARTKPVCEHFWAASWDGERVQAPDALPAALVNRVGSLGAAGSTGELYSTVSPSIETLG
jgi:hypothetical protein